MIFADRFRTQERNRADALERLPQLDPARGGDPEAAPPTKPTAASRERRLKGEERAERRQEARADAPRGGLSGVPASRMPSTLQAPGPAKTM